MAVLGRDDIQQITSDKLPTNNAKLITAAKHREVLKDFRESFFNLVDDALADITYEVQGNDTITLGDYLSTLFQNSVKRIKVGVFDIGGLTYGDSVPVEDPYGLVASATVEENAEKDSLIKITWAGNSGIDAAKAKIPVMHYNGLNWNNSNDSFATIQDNGGYIFVAFREVATNQQTNSLEIIIL